MFGAPPVPLFPTLLLLSGVVLFWATLRTWRTPLLARIAARNVPRRTMRSALIVLGLTISSTVIGSALGTGDAMRFSVQSVVTESLGTVDEIIIAQTPQRNPGNALHSLTEPGIAALAATRPGFFPDTQIEPLTQAVDGSGVVAALTPVIAQQVSIVNPAQQQLTSSVLLLALPTAPPAAFGELTSGGSSVDPARLGADQILVNVAAAAQLNIGSGGTLQLLSPDGVWADKAIGEPWNVTVTAVLDNGGIVGNQPVLIMPLARYQAAIGQPGMVNQILVVNRGGVASVEQTSEALRFLRQQLVNPDAARRLHDILATPSFQRGLENATQLVDERFREQIRILSNEARKPDVSAEFISIVSDPQMRIALYQLTRAGLTGEQQRETFHLLRTISDLSVLPVKQQGIDQANEYGRVVSAVFLVLGVFSIAAALLLIYLTFSLLAADRSADLATMRALGMRNRQVMDAFLLEGLIYAIPGALLGMLASFLAAALTTLSLSRALESFGLSLRMHIDPSTALTALLLGFLLTFAAMVVSAWRVSRLGIVAATQGLQTTSGYGLLILPGIVLLLGAALLWRSSLGTSSADDVRHPVLLPSTLTLAIIGCWCLVAAFLQRHRYMREGLALAVCVITIIVWLRSMTHTPTIYGDVFADALTIAVGGVVLMLCVTWTTVFGAGPVLHITDALLSPWGRLRATARAAIAQIRWQRWRTALVVIMFGMIVLTMTTSLALIASLLHAYGIGDAPVAGFELRADLTGAQRIPDLRAAMANADSVAPQSFTAIGGVRTLDTQMIAVDAKTARWQGTTLVAADDDFLNAVQVPIQQRASGYANDADVWRALRDTPGNAVITPALLQALRRDSPASDSTQWPKTIWVRPGGALDTAGAPLRLRVLGVVDARADLSGDVYTSTASARGLGVELPLPSTWYLAVRQGVSLDDAAQGLTVAFSNQGLKVTNLGDALRISQSLRSMLTRLVQGFLGLGLIAGFVALGLLGVQAVIERQRDIGTLRALGFTRRQSGWSLALESAIIASLGILLGVGLGVFLAWTLIRVLAAHWMELTFMLPTSQIATTVGLALLGSAAAVMITAVRAMRVSPADALRT